jgi:phosphoketolase
MDAYWRAANYLSVGQIYLYDNPLLKRPWSRASRWKAPAVIRGPARRILLH